MKTSITHKLYLVTLDVIFFLYDKIGISLSQNYDAILCYHDISKSEWQFSVSKNKFREQMKYLIQKFNVVPLDEILTKPNSSDKPRVAITFDDGFKSVFNNALPIMEELGIIATVFINDNKNLNIKSNNDNFLSKNDLKKILAKHWSIGWHTNDHKHLLSIAAKEINKQVNISRISKEKKYGLKLKYFAYPYGKYNDNVIRIIKKGNIKYSFTVDGGQLNLRDKHLIARNSVDRHMSPSQIVSMLTPLGLTVTQLFNKFWKLFDTRLSYKPKMDKRQKKIIFSSFDDINNPYYGGGGARSIHEVAKRLSKEYQVFVITGKYPGSINETVDNVIYERVGLSFLPPKINQGFFHFLLVYKTLTKNYDLWIENFTPPTSTSFLPLFTRKPVIGLVHMLSGEDMQRKYKLPFKFIQNIGLKFYDYFIAVNKKDIDKIKSINPKANFINIPNGIQIPRSITSTKNNILFLGRIEVDQKGLDLLIKAYSNIADKTTSNLIIAGSGTDIEVKKLQKLLQNFHLNGKAKLLGRVDEKEKNKLLRKSALVVIPSRYETFSVTALEGLSYGAPIVSFDLPGLEWIPDNLAYKTKSFNIEDFSKNILKALKEEQTATSKRQKRINFAKNYDWQRIEKMYKSYIDQILI